MFNNAKIPPSISSNELSQFRKCLPTYQLRQTILDTIGSNIVTLITGGTGCGKTTQVPQFLLEDACSSKTPVQIICTQPRRLPALSVAKRVARERGERLGDTVGYHIRLEQKTSESTSLTYCTSGVLLRMLTGDELATGVSHIILDEIHERETNTDYLLIALKQALKKRNDLKLVLMSATLEGNLNIFMKYFDRSSTGYVDIPSRLFSVDKLYLPDVLALTGYMPRSICGVFSTNTLQNSQFSTHAVPACNSNGFPPVGVFRCDAAPSTSSINYNYPTLPPAVNVGHGIHHSITEPNFGIYGIQQPNQYYPDPFDDPPFGSGFGFNRHEFIMQEQIAQAVKQILPDRPDSFDPDYLRNFRQRRHFIRDKELVNAYLAAGGQQWVEGIDNDLVLELIRYLLGCKLQGAILVFLPGFDDISTLRGCLEQLTIRESRNISIHSLHSQINTIEQQRVFEKVPPGCRKVILSTNIAEASLTIDDVVFVIDCGKAKEKIYEHDTRISILKTGWIAKSNAEQRSGRAGRCRDGFCFRLYTNEDYEKMLSSQIPEMLRTAIHEVCLHAKMFSPSKMTVKEFLMEAPEPPATTSVDRSLEFLEQLGALYTPKSSTTITKEVPCTNLPPYTLPNKMLFSGRGRGFSRNTKRNDIGYGLGFETTWNTEHGLGWVSMNREPDLTQLGRIIAHLPLDPQLSRLLLFGLALRCFSPVLTLVAALSYRDPFILPLGDDRTVAASMRDVFSRRDFSDHLVLIRAYNAYQKADDKSKFCDSMYLSRQAMDMIKGIRRQLIIELRRYDLLHANYRDQDDLELDKFSSHWPMVQAAIVAGCFPSIAYVRPGTKLRKIKTSTNANASLHPSSVIKRQIQPSHKRSDEINRHDGSDNDPNLEYFVYQELAKLDEGLTLKTITVVPPLTVFFFAGPIRLSKSMVEKFEIDDYSNSQRNKRLEQEEETRRKLMEEKREYHRRDQLQRKRNIARSRRYVREKLGLLNGDAADNENLDEISDDSFSSASDVHIEESELFYSRQDHIVELEHWLAFRGTFDTMQALVRMRFKLMRFFIRFIKHPAREYTPEEEEMLECLSLLLASNHKENYFQEVANGLHDRIHDHHNAISSHRPANAHNTNNYRPNSNNANNSFNSRPKVCNNNRIFHNSTASTFYRKINTRKSIPNNFHPIRLTTAEMRAVPPSVNSTSVKSD